MTTFKHTALVCRREDNADRFYETLLGLEKATPKIVPAGLARDLFGIESELTMINYTGNGMHFEIFIADRTPGRDPKIAHTCIEVASRSRFLEHCGQLDVTVRQVPKGDKTLLFIRDFDGNLFEVKARAD